MKGQSFLGTMLAGSVLAWGVVCSPDTPGAEKKRNAPSFRRWGYYLSGSLSKATLADKLTDLDVLSVTGYVLDSAGRLYTSSEHRTAARLARSQKKTLFPLIVFRNAAQGRHMLQNGQARARAIRVLSRLARRKGVTGIHLDFEYLSPTDAPLLARFLAELRPALRGRLLTMAIFPQLEFPPQWAGFHDLERISPFLDQIVLMCYDLHRPNSKPGPVTDLAWCERNIRFALRYFKSHQIWLGVPGYGYAWTSGRKGRVISARAGARLAARVTSKRHQSGVLFFQYRSGNSLWKVYLADSETRRRMEDLARRMQLAGTALWRLGFE